MFAHKLQMSEILLLAAGIGMLVSLPWLESNGLWIWFSAKAAYVAGVIFFVLKK